MGGIGKGQKGYGKVGKMREGDRRGSGGNGREWKGNGKG